MLALLIASYVFYSWWDVRFLALIVFSTTLDFYLGLAIDRQHNERLRRAMMWISVAANLAVLGFFKYFNFFSESFRLLLQNMGFHASWPTLNIILPVGVSFFTFESMSYVLEVYWRRMPACRNYFHYALFIAFFPHLVAGPIIRPHLLLPQFYSERAADPERFFSGFFRFSTGIFKKLLIADNLAYLFIDPVMNNPGRFSGLEILLATWGYAFQIYYDFSGYSDMALGLSRMLGFDLPENFRWPYLATSIRDFWKRWHISLSSWLRDYLYIPLGGGRTESLWRKYRNIFITMVLGGFWHGAHLNFILWGIFHGSAIVVSHIKKDLLKFGDPVTPLARWAAIAITFNTVCLGWIFFRCSWHDAFAAIRLIAVDFFPLRYRGPEVFPVLLVLAAVLHVFGERLFGGAYSWFQRWPIPGRIAYGSGLAGLVFVLSKQYSPFIYFQF